MAGYCLQSKTDEMKELINETIQNFRLDEKDRINDITKMHISGFERNLVNSGHYFAMTNSDAQIFSSRHQLSAGIIWLSLAKV